MVDCLVCCEPDKELQPRALPKDRMANKKKGQVKHLKPEEASRFLAMFYSYNALPEPREIVLPLSDEVFMKLFSARDAFVAKAHGTYSPHALRHKETRSDVEARLSQHEEKTRAMLLKACKEGKGIYRTRLGMDLAMFEELSSQEQEKGLELGRERMSNMSLSKENLVRMMTEKLKQEDEALRGVKNVDEWFSFNYNPMKFSLS